MRCVLLLQNRYLSFHSPPTTLLHSSTLSDSLFLALFCSSLILEDDDNSSTDGSHPCTSILDLPHVRRLCVVSSLSPRDAGSCAPPVQSAASSGAAWQQPPSKVVDRGRLYAVYVRNGWCIKPLEAVSVSEGGRGIAGRRRIRRNGLAGSR